MTFTNISSVSLDRLAYATEGVVVKLDTIMKILERFVKLQEAQLKFSETVSEEILTLGKQGDRKDV
tara:strand:+ start:44 stop:241 length:198 start_codon:yes stop_codon:yes gene_type:complete